MNLLDSNDCEIFPLEDINPRGGASVTVTNRGSKSAPLVPQKEVVFKKKESFFSLEESEFRQPAVLTLQVWDYDRIAANDFLGKTADSEVHHTFTFTEADL